MPDVPSIIKIFENIKRYSNIACSIIIFMATSPGLSYQKLGVNDFASRDSNDIEGIVRILLLFHYFMGKFIMVLILPISI